MAKWVLSTPPPFTGTQDDVTVYQLRSEKYYIRMKSSITAERIKKDPAFKGFRKSSFRMKDASPIATSVYKQFAVKSRSLRNEMTGKALVWLKQGLSPAVIKERLIQEYRPQEKPAVRVKRVTLYKIPPVTRVQLPNHVAVIYNHPDCVVLTNDWNDS